MRQNQHHAMGAKKNKMRLITSALVSVVLPMAAGAAEWHFVPDEIPPGVPVSGIVIGAVLVDSIKRNEDYAEAQVAAFYTANLIEAIFAKSRKNSDYRAKLRAALATGRADAYAGMESSFLRRSLEGSAEDVRAQLVASEILIEDGYAPIFTQTIQVKCKSKAEFEYRFSQSTNWTWSALPRDGSEGRGVLLPFICDKAGMGQNAPAPPPPPSPEMVLLQQIFDMRVVPKWNFLGVRTEDDGRSYFVFFGADTIQRKETYTDVVTGSVKYHHGPNEPPNYPDELMPPNALISKVLEGRHRPESLSITHVDCNAATVLDYSEAKMFESQLVSYVCSHAMSRQTRGGNRHQ